jgi:hypothetical protein
VLTETAKSPWTWEDPNAVRIRVSLDGVEPAIFRRLVVPLDNTLAQLHHILQAAMGWTDSHLHRFEVGGVRFGDPELLNEDMPDDFQQGFDASSVRLRDFHFDDVDELSFVYLYDFGDSWQHTVTLEKLLAVKPAPKTATCIEGARRVQPGAVRCGEDGQGGARCTEKATTRVTGNGKLPTNFSRLQRRLDPERGLHSGNRVLDRKIMLLKQQHSGSQGRI